MTVSRQLKQYASRRITRRLYRSLPWIGGLAALVTVGQAIRRKGFVGGTIDTALDFIPFVGAAKNIAEVSRGRDFIRDREAWAKSGDLAIGSSGHLPGRKPR
jgi:hypothetical protein